MKDITTTTGTKSSQSGRLRDMPKSRWLVLLGLCVFAAVLWGANWFLASHYYHDPMQRGLFGDMFGAVNALFTALAFAGLFFALLLQRDQLILQQRELAESSALQQDLTERQLKAQEQLFERQKGFQEEQRAKQVEHELALERLRDDLAKMAEDRSEQKAQRERADFERNLVKAIRVELTGLRELYKEGIGKHLQDTPEGEPLLTRVAVSQEWFTVFTANAQHLGRVDHDLARRIIRSYVLVKSLIEEFRINHVLIDEYERIQIEWATGNPPQGIEIKHERVKSWMIRQTTRLKQQESVLFQEVDALFSAMDDLEAL